MIAATSHKNNWLDLCENFTRGVSLDKEVIIEFWKSSGSWFRPRNFFERIFQLWNRSHSTNFANNRRSCQRILMKSFGGKGCVTINSWLDFDEEKQKFLTLPLPKPPLETAVTRHRLWLAAQGWRTVYTNGGGKLHRHNYQRAAGRPQLCRLADVGVNELKMSWWRFMVSQVLSFTLHLHITAVLMYHWPWLTPKIFPFLWGAIMPVS